MSTAHSDLPTTALPADALGTLDAVLAARYSCRAYRPDQVPTGTIELILSTAQRTASWCNSQSWQVAVTRGAGTERLRSALYTAATTGAADRADIDFPREYRGVHKDRRRTSGYQLYSALGIERDDQERRALQMAENFRFFGAPHVAIIHCDEALGAYGAVDCGGYVANFLSAATALGIGTVAQAALAMYPSVLRRELGLGEDRTVVCGISFGYPDADHPINGYRTDRAPLAEVVDWIDD